MKRAKLFVLVMFFALTLFAFCGTTVNAEEGNATLINSVEELKELFGNQDVTYSGTKVTLNSDVTVDDVVNIMEGEYNLNLNGHTLKAAELYIYGGKVTIDDATAVGKIDTRFVEIGEAATVVVNQCIFETDLVDEFEGEEPWEVRTDLMNYGNLTFKNGSIENTLWNCEGGVVVIENGTIPNISQFGTATIKNGNFHTLNTDITIGSTKILGGKFAGWEADNFSVMIQSSKEVDEHT